MSIRKTAERSDAHAIFQSPDGSWTWYILKAYSTPKGEAKNPNARWLCCVTSPFVGGSGEIGDTYVRDVKSGGTLIECSQEWADTYGLTELPSKEHNENHN